MFLLIKRSRDTVPLRSFRVILQRLFFIPISVSTCSSSYYYLYDFAYLLCFVKLIWTRILSAVFSSWTISKILWKEMVLLKMLTRFKHTDHFSVFVKLSVELQMLQAIVSHKLWCPKCLIFCKNNGVEVFGVSRFQTFSDIFPFVSTDPKNKPETKAFFGRES